MKAPYPAMRIGAGLDEPMIGNENDSDVKCSVKLLDWMTNIMGGRSSKYLMSGDNQYSQWISISQNIIWPVCGNLNQTGLITLLEGLHPLFCLRTIINFSPCVLVPKVIGLATKQLWWMISAWQQIHLMTFKLTRVPCWNDLQENFRPIESTL